MTQEALKLAHWSDCAVHREPAYPNGECDCGGIVAVADYTALSDKYVALSDKYVALSDKYVALSDKYVALKAQHKEQESVRVPWSQELESVWAEKDEGEDTPPQRTWVDLTAEQMLECNIDGKWTVDRETAKLNVQAKLKELNT